MFIGNRELFTQPDNVYEAFVAFGSELYFYDFDEFMTCEEI